ncbi:sel1 repeat family protein [Salmonella enterica subsp. enterica serovar Ituri]|nr:sel1 repeat family protein [Salmonella enterica subsp. enterica serovar Ituri]
MKKIFITIIVSLYCANICAKESPSTESKPVNFIAQIENIDFNKTAISSDLKLLLADRYYFKDKTPCNTNTLSARAESMGLTTEEYINKIRSLRPAILDDRYFYLTVDQCDAGGTPMLTGIELCTEALCGYHNDEELSELYAPTDVTNKAKQGDSTAQYHLGKYEFECTNYDAAMKWLTQSAEQNHPGALLFLAYAYNDGDGVAQDSKKYLSYLFKAAELGESDAQLEVGYLNLIGEGMPKNLPEAYKWIKKSADQGNAQAHYNLGLMYRNGDGVEKDLNKAKLHLTAAVKGGVKPALAALKELTPQTK